MSDINQDIVRALKQSHGTAKFASRIFSELESQFNAIKIAAGDEHSEIYRLANLGRTMAQISADTVVMDSEDIRKELELAGASSTLKGGA